MRYSTTTHAVSNHLFDDTDYAVVESATLVPRRLKADTQAESIAMDLAPPAWGGEWEAREVAHLTADAWLARYHYLGACPAGAVARIGVFCPDMIAVTVYAQATNAHGLAKKFDLANIPGNYEISRVATHPDAPRNTTSRAVALCNRLFHTMYQSEWVFSYADTGQDHHGGIYQALNAVYVGVSDTRHGFLLDGAPIHPRSVVAWLGTQARVEATRLAAELGHTLEWVDDLNTAKHTYIIPLGNARQRRRVTARLQPYVQPYPKRVSSDH